MTTPTKSKRRLTSILYRKQTDCEYIQKVCPVNFSWYRSFSGKLKQPFKCFMYIIKMRSKLSQLTFVLMEICHILLVGQYDGLILRYNLSAKILPAWRQLPQLFKLTNSIQYKKWQILNCLSLLHTRDGTYTKQGMFTELVSDL